MLFGKTQKQRVFLKNRKNSENFFFEMGCWVNLGGGLYFSKKKKISGLGTLIFFFGKFLFNSLRQPRPTFWYNKGRGVSKGLWG